MPIRQIATAVLLWSLTMVATREVGVDFSDNCGYGVAIRLRRFPIKQVWIHCNPKDLCVSVGHDWYESGRWRRDCVGAQITNNWLSSFRRQY